jgi:hypothetical protein
MCKKGIIHTVFIQGGLKSKVTCFDAENFILILMYIRWYTADLHVGSIDV